MPTLDEAAIERALRTYRLVIPRMVLAGRVGGVTGTRAGGSLELHDFREYQPGDDVRQVDWNAVARTGQLIVRIRREEITPRVEIVLDASKSMALTEAKSTRALELATLLVRLAQQQGLEPSLIVARSRVDALRRPSPEALAAIQFDGVLPLDQPLHREGALRNSGIRIVISDFLFEAQLDALCGRLSKDAALVTLVQVMDSFDLNPEASEGATLIDSEAGEQLDRLLSPKVVESYRRRLATHQSQLIAGARRAHARWCQCVAQESLENTLKAQLLGTVLEVRA